jgi:hypothetical protein
MLLDLVFYSLPFVPMATALAVLYFEADHLKEDRKEEENP